MVRPRKAVERLKPYHPPREGRGGKLRLDFNENTVGCAPQVIRALRNKLDGDWLSRYPEYEEAREALARILWRVRGRTAAGQRHRRRHQDGLRHVRRPGR